VAEGAVIDVVGLLGGRPVGAAAEAALRRATLVAGGHDQLAAVADLVAPGARTVVVGAGLGALDEVAASPGPACVLASGDPGCFGILRPLAARIGADRVAVHPAPSSVALAFARLGLPWDHAVVSSCHRGGAARAAAEVARLPTAAVLCGPDAPPEAVGAALLALGAAHHVVAVATRVGEPGEQVQRCPDVAALAAGRFDARSVVVLADLDPSPVGPAGRPGGRPVVAFAHRASLITKPEVRSVVLGKLDLPDRGVLWDVGAGSGSVAIEAALAAPGLRVVAVERRADDAARVLANAACVGTVVEVVEGAAPAVLASLPAPDRVFVGGGGLDVLDACVAALRPGGRVVATFAAIDRAAEAHRRLGSLVQVGVDRAEALPDGGVRFVADNPVFVAWGDRPAEPPRAAGRIAVGVGCSSAATADEIGTVMAQALADAGSLGGATAPPRSAADGGVARVAGVQADPSVRSPGPIPDAGPPAAPIGQAAQPDAAAGAGLNAAAAAAEPVPSEEPGGQDRGCGSSQELEGSFPTVVVTQRNPAGAGGPPAPQRGEGAPDPSSSEAGGAGAQQGQPAVVLATIDQRREHPAVVAAAGDRPVFAFPPALLGLVDVPDPSHVVDAAVGTPSVAEAAALLAAGPGARLVVGKQRGASATAAVAVGGRPAGIGRVQIVGLGPGHPRHRTPAAAAAVREADAVVGYGPYVDAAAALLRPEQLVVRSSMGAEAERASAALALARAGWRVALVSSGDPGVFAMASVTLELAATNRLRRPPEVVDGSSERPVGAAAGSDRPPGAGDDVADVLVEVVPGVTASSAAAAVVGAPLAGPHAVLTLSDLLLPWSSIEAQLRAAAGAGMALALYNPRSAGRPDHLARARAVLLELLDPATPVAVVTAAADTGERSELTTLGDLDPTVASMRSLVLVGTADTVVAGDRLVTRRHHPRQEVTG